MARLVTWLAGLDVRRVTLVLAALIGGMAVCGLAALALDRGNAWLDLDSEVQLAWPIGGTTVAIPAAISGLLLVVAAIAWLAVWTRWPDRGTRVLVVALSLGLALTGADELIGLHERLERRTGIDWQTLYALPALVMAVAFLVVLWRLRLQDRRAAWVLLAGGLAWGASQVLEFLQWRGDQPVDAYVLLMVPEELLEAVGSSLLLLAAIGTVQAIGARRPGGERAAAVTEGAAGPGAGR